MIPGELQKLIRMIPEGQGQGKGQPKDDGKGKGDKPEDAKEREAQKRLEEQERQEKQGQKKDPKDGAERPRDPKDRGEGKRDPDKPEQNDPQDDGKDAWAAALPPQIRDAVQNGDFNKIPAKYRSLVERYLKWLSKNGGKRR